jgi:hypothetical protein
MKQATSFLIALVMATVAAHAQVDYSFSAVAGSYTPLTAATTVTLTAANPGGRALLDESFANNIPIGFVFQYNGLNYKTIHLNANGMASLGAAFVANTAANPGYDINELRAATGFRGVTRPVLAPLWDNLTFATANDLTYKTEGSSPNRVFTAQWQNMLWQTGSAAVSFQLKLYETSNIIEFVYRQESNAGSGTKSASIGITAEAGAPLTDDDPGTFLSLGNATATPTVSSTAETETINARPATGQVYRFTPLPCAGPSGVKTVRYGQNTATIYWTARTGVAGYQYGFSTIEVPPSTTVATAETVVSLSGLSPNTTYYFYVRSQCGSAWRVLRFPYTEGFEAALDNSLPRPMRRETTSNGFADVFWQTTNLLPAATGTKTAINTAPFVAAQTWLYTPGISLTGGTAYKLIFKYATTSGTQALDVRYGTETGAVAMTNTLFSSSTIANTSFQSTTVTFWPLATGTYYVGFLYKSAANAGIFLLDDIAVLVDANPATVCINNPFLPTYALGASAQVKAQNTITAINQINSGANVLLQAGDYVDLNPGFDATAGAEVIVQTGPCNN